jgi:RNA polymerase sigma-70 factor (ECF subfamily)
MSLHEDQDHRVDASRDEDPEEKALVEGLLRRDPASVSRFLESTHRPVYAMACRLTADPELRQDWAHDVLLRILDELGQGRFVYRWPGCFWSWFKKRSHFLLLNLHQKERRRMGRDLDGEWAEDVIDRLEMPTSTDPDRLVQGMEARSAIEDCMEKLPSEDQQRALRLLLLEEMAYEEIAHAMAAQLNTVRSWIRRARIAVRECLSSVYRLDEALEE